MDRKQALSLLVMLSAIESWAYSTGKPLPEYLHSQMDKAVVLLGKMVLDEDNRP